ncbi:MAG TPA: Gfo/Idh/MocA family oxidoreductase [Anaerolineaceae bacterium]|nr:Gfo/Idh/MocA family oxidoreductase [Anaerolineaceae bacterium]
MKFLIAGFGSIGRRHLRNLRALGENDILLYRTHHSTLPDDEIAGLVVETDLQAALAHRPDAVIIANPTALHLCTAIPAAKAGCSILMEKPVSQSLEDIEELENALQSNKGRFLVGYQFRFHPGLQQIARLLDENAIGRVISVRAHWGEYLPGWHPWEDHRKSYAARQDLGGGVVNTLSHPLDYLRWLIGEIHDLQTFTAVARELQIEVEAVAEVLLRFQNGALGSLHLDYIQRPAQHDLEIIGSEGTIRWDNADGVTQIYRVPRGEWELFPVPQGFERNTMFIEELRHFIAVTRGETPPLCTLSDGKRAIELAQKILGTKK